MFTHNQDFLVYNIYLNERENLKIFFAIIYLHETYFNLWLYRTLRPFFQKLEWEINILFPSLSPSPQHLVQNVSSFNKHEQNSN